MATKTQERARPNLAQQAYHAVNAEELFEIPAKGREAQPAQQVHYIKVSDIVADTEQPRQSFTKEDIAQLQATIEAHQMLQPIVVRPLPPQSGMNFGATKRAHKIVFGERRWRAAKELNLETIPAIIRDVNAAEAATLQLTENLSRKDLTPLEIARGIKRWMELHKYSKADAVRELKAQFGFQASAGWLDNRLYLTRVKHADVLKLAEERGEDSLVLVREIDKVESGQARAALIKQRLEHNASTATIKEKVAALTGKKPKPQPAQVPTPQPSGDWGTVVAPIDAVQGQVGRLEYDYAQNGTNAAPTATETPKTGIVAGGLDVLAMLDSIISRIEAGEVSEDVLQGVRERTRRLVEITSAVV